jgi:hypothetical protein
MKSAKSLGHCRRSASREKGRLWSEIRDSEVTVRAGRRTGGTEEYRSVDIPALLSLIELEKAEKCDSHAF